MKEYLFYYCRLLYNLRRKQYYTVLFLIAGKPPLIYNNNMQSIDISARTCKYMNIIQLSLAISLYNATEMNMQVTAIIERFVLR